MNLFGDSDYLEKLSLKGDPLERLEKVVDFECFRPTLNRIFKYDLRFCCKVFQKIYFSVKLRKKTERTE